MAVVVGSSVDQLISGPREREVQITEGVLSCKAITCCFVYGSEEVFQVVRVDVKQREKKAWTER